MSCLLLSFAGPVMVTPAQAAPVGGFGPAALSGAGARFGIVPPVGAAPSGGADDSHAASAGNNLFFTGNQPGVGVDTGAPKVYLVFWGSQWGSQSIDAKGYLALSGDPAGMAPDLQALMKGMGTGGETWSGVVTQYCQGVAYGTGTCPATASHVGYPTGGALAGVWEDTATLAPASATQHALASEAVIAANHFGRSTQASNSDAQYLIVSPTGTAPDGFGPASVFCGWHSYSSENLAGGGPVAGPFAVAFTNTPYLPDVGAYCGANFVNRGPAGELDGVNVIASHEYAETITDPFPFGGWIDQQRFETGDKCDWITGAQGAVRDISLTTGTFAMQSLWANDYNAGAGGCELSHSIVADNSARTAPAINTSVGGVTFSSGAPGTFTVSASGQPIPAIKETGSLPAGVSFVDENNGTGTLSGSATTAGTFALTLTATNATGTASQGFTLTVIPWSGIISNFAGDPAGKAGDTGDGGAATAATLGQPAAVAADSAGNVYLVEYGGNRVRKVGATGVITNLAGSPAGTAGNAGDGGPATAATLDHPNGLAVDSAGNVYIADYFVNRVRKVDTNGSITNFAGSPAGTVGDTGDGGPATSATLSAPDAVAVDLAGNVYIADSYNNRVRKVDPSGTITNFGGSPSAIAGNTGDGGPAASATLDHPTGVAVDAPGNVYIVDSNNNRVRKVDASGTITNLAGSPSGLAGNTGDGGPATFATLDHPSGVAVDRAGNVYLSDGNNHRVREVDHGGTMSDFAGNSAGLGGNIGDGGLATSAFLHGPQGVAAGSTGNVYVVDATTNRVRQVRPGPAIVSAPSANFAVGLANTFAVMAAGLPAPNVTETGALPSGVNFNGASAELTGTPSQGSAGAYPITLEAVNAVGSATQTFTLTVSQVMMTYPANGQANVDTTQPFTWSTIPQAQGYLLSVGTTRFGTNLLHSAILPSTQSSYLVPPLPVGPPLYATLLTEVDGGWTSYEAITFTAAQVRATFTFPLNGQTSVDPTQPFSWSAKPLQASAYILVVGTTHFGSNLVNSGILSSSQSSYPTPALPAGKTLYATLLTEIGGEWSGFQAVTFSTGPTMATFTHPVAGQLNVTVPGSFTWKPLHAAQNYILAIGTTLYGTNLVNSGLLAPTQSSYSVPALPHGETLYATLLTRVNGNWVYQVIGFTAA